MFQTVMPSALQAVTKGLQQPESPVVKAQALSSSLLLQPGRHHNDNLEALRGHNTAHDTQWMPNKHLLN